MKPLSKLKDLKHYHHPATFIRQKLAFPNNHLTPLITKNNISYNKEYIYKNKYIINKRENQNELMEPNSNMLIIKVTLVAVAEHQIGF